MDQINQGSVALGLSALAAAFTASYMLRGNKYEEPAAPELETASPAKVRPTKKHRLVRDNSQGIVKERGLQRKPSIL